MSYTLIKGGKTIEGKTIEFIIHDGKIVDVSDDLSYREVDDEIDISGCFISPGWIDDHVHCYEKMNLYYDFPDEIGIKKGVTTVIDAGSTGADNIEEFYSISRKNKTNVLAMINISRTGIVHQNELADLDNIREDLIAQRLEEYPDFIVGIKARMSKSVIGDNGIKPLEMAKKIQKHHNNLPLMVHIGSNPPELKDILELLDPGDIVTHCFNGKENGILDKETGTIKQVAQEAFKRGVIFDIGHGTDSFNFDVANVANQHSIGATSISTDIYVRNRTNGPVFDMATTCNKLRLIGYSWKQIIECITEIPAKSFHLTNKGKMDIGKDADFTVFRIENKKETLIDSNGNTAVTAEVIQPVKVIIGGVLHDID